MATGNDDGGQPCDSVDSEDLLEIKCQPCHEDGHIKEAVGLCIDCQDYLCRTCFDSHTIPRPCRTHNLLDKQQMLQSRVKLQRKDTCTKKCSLHEDDIIKYYCIEHGQLGCSVCLNLDHRTCKAVKYIPHVAKSLDDNTEYTQVEAVLTSSTNLCKKLSDIGNALLEGIETSYVEVIQKLETYREKVNFVLDKMQTDLAETAEAMKMNVLEKANNFVEKHCAKEKTLLEVYARIKKLKSTHRSCDLYIETIEMRDKVNAIYDEMKEEEDELLLQETQIQFEPNLKLLKVLETPGMFGQLTGENRMTTVYTEQANEELIVQKCQTMSSTSVEHLQILTPTEVVGELAMDERLPILGTEHIFDINVKTDLDKKECMIAGSAILNKNTLLISDWSNSAIKIVGIDKNVITMHAKLSSAAWDLCKINENQVAMSMPEKKKIVFLSIDSSMHVDKTMKVNNRCFGLDYKMNKLAVSFCNPHKVQIFTIQGTLLHDIETDQFLQKTFSLPFHLAFGKDAKTLFVSNYDSHDVVCVEMDGTLVAAFGDYGLESPRGVVVDSDGYTYACGIFSDNIYQISPDCTHGDVLLDSQDGLRYPQSITYNEVEDHFYVGMFGSNGIKVFKAIRKTEESGFDTESSSDTDSTYL